MTTLQNRLAEMFPEPHPRGFKTGVASLCGVTPASVSNWFGNPEKVATISRENAEKLVSNYRLAVSPAWLAEGKGPKYPVEAPRPVGPNDTGAPTVVRALEDDFVAVRRADVRFSNGAGEIFYENDDKPPLVFRMDFLRKLGIKSGKAVVVDSKGISNEPKIRDRSVVLVNAGDTEHLDGDFFAFRYDGELLIKRLERVPGVGILATAENSSFRPKSRLYTELNDFEVIGRCVWEGAEL
ncbi:S24 family peptidase [Acidovorax sp.]|uniref:S24 family peptidase n=1 Tax=Acidovorax sp. TaxID=1872122 RepID=UPI002ACD7FC2|nr:S24 family peptidase [Acidovorax sp.]MDZ7863362.1 S24 family peptidase [Acidovorax sp.]